MKYSAKAVTTWSSVTGPSAAADCSARSDSTPRARRARWTSSGVTEASPSPSARAITACRNGRAISANRAGLSRSRFTAPPTNSSRVMRWSPSRSAIPAMPCQNASAPMYRDWPFSDRAVTPNSASSTLAAVLKSSREM
ncbi:hypothetical protein AT728_04890 [Streptomyces silvensis]|uniref:Uncharacterized protein n=1 Tax=Streptomyces silvensis TaxID=1765722 RepID=A0A0W7XA80_9ACTN|nr:hypothetical protein AT728_04890 [Streptomyces silvensis]